MPGECFHRLSNHGRHGTDGKENHERNEGHETISVQRRQPLMSSNATRHASFPLIPCVPWFTLLDVPVNSQLLFRRDGLAGTAGSSPAVFGTGKEIRATVVPSRESIVIDPPASVAIRQAFGRPKPSPRPACRPE